MKRAVLLILALAVLAGSVNGDEIDDGIRAAREFLDQGDADSGIAILRSLRKNFPDDVRPIPLLAFFLIEKEDALEEAGELLEEYLQHLPADQWALNQLAVVADRALDAGDPEFARRCAKLLMLARPRNKEDRYLWAAASYRMGEGGSVHGATRELIREFPSFAPPYWLLARVLEEEGRFRDAAEVYRDLLREHTADPDARMARASILLWQLRDYDGAEAEYLSALVYTEPDTEKRTEAEAGIVLVRNAREKSIRLRDHRSFLNRMMLGSLAGWGLLLVLLAWLLRRR